MEYKIDLSFNSTFFRSSESQPISAQAEEVATSEITMQFCQQLLSINPNDFDTFSQVLFRFLDFLDNSNSFLNLNILYEHQFHHSLFELIHAIPLGLEQPIFHLFAITTRHHLIGEYYSHEGAFQFLTQLLKNTSLPFYSDLLDSMSNLIPHIVSMGIDVLGLLSLDEYVNCRLRLPLIRLFVSLAKNCQDSDFYEILLDNWIGDDNEQFYFSRPQNDEETRLYLDFCYWVSQEDSLVERVLLIAEITKNSIDCNDIYSISRFQYVTHRAFLQEKKENVLQIANFEWVLDIFRDTENSNVKTCCLELMLLYAKEALIEPDLAFILSQFNEMTFIQKNMILKIAVVGVMNGSENCAQLIASGQMISDLLKELDLDNPQYSNLIAYLAYKTYQELSKRNQNALQFLENIEQGGVVEFMEEAASSYDNQDDALFASRFIEWAKCELDKNN